MTAAARISNEDLRRALRAGAGERPAGWQSSTVAPGTDPVYLVVRCAAEVGSPDTVQTSERILATPGAVAARMADLVDRCTDIWLARLDDAAEDDRPIINKTVERGRRLAAQIRRDGIPTGGSAELNGLNNSVQAITEPELQQAAQTSARAQASGLTAGERGRRLSERPDDPYHEAFNRAYNRHLDELGH